MQKVAGGQNYFIVIHGFRSGHQSKENSTNLYGMRVKQKIREKKSGKGKKNEKDKESEIKTVCFLKKDFSKKYMYVSVV